MKNIPLYKVRKITNLKDMINGSVELYKDRPAFHVKEKEGGSYIQIPFIQLKKDMDAFGTRLQQMGLKDAKIAVIAENRYHWAITYLSVVNGLGIIVPLDKELPLYEIENLIIRSGAKAVVYSEKTAEKLSAIISHLSTVEYFINMDNVLSQFEGKTVLLMSKLISEGQQLINSGDQSYINTEIDNTAMSVLLFTSGTTDTSKAVMLSHENLAENLMGMTSMLNIVESDIFLSILPLHHTYECTCGFLCPLFRGASIAYCEGLRHIAKNLHESKSTVMLGVPLIFEAMYAKIWDNIEKDPKTLKKARMGLKISNLLKKVNIDISKKLFAQIHNSIGGHVRILISGAAGIDPIVAKGFREFGIPMVQGYGLTECSPIVALNRDIDFKDSSAGLPLPNAQVKISNPNSEGIGEIIVKAASVMLGYFENLEATNKVMNDGWFHTGDLGYFDKDGFVYITGRSKNVIVTKNGKNIFPEEIETLLGRCRYIKESLVHGENDASGDIYVFATIVPDIERLQQEKGVISFSDPAVAEIIKSEIKAVNKTLIQYKHIKDFSLREEEFSKTTSKKIKRHLETVK
jgi:long-chain acyl-CoA synthetase